MPDPGSGGHGTGDRQDRRALFEQEVERLMDRLYGTALRLTGNRDDAEDVVADAVGKAWSKLDELRDTDALEGWLFRILNNTFVSHWRRRRAQWEVEQEMAEGVDVENFSLFHKLHQPFLLWWGTPEQQFLNDVLQEDIQRALDSLPDAFRVTVVMVDVQGYSYDETSELLAVPVGTVRSRLSRGRSLLQKALWAQAADAGLVRGPSSAQRNEGEAP